MANSNLLKTPFSFYWAADELLQLRSTIIGMDRNTLLLFIDVALKRDMCCCFHETDIEKSWRRGFSVLNVSQVQQRFLCL